MKPYSLGFIGGGRITRIFLQAFAAKNIPLKTVRVFDTNSEVLAELKAAFPYIETVGSAEEAATEINVFIALHPPAIAETLTRVKTFIRPEASVVSLAPKISAEKMHQILGRKNIVRLIPNATSYINQGYNPVFFYPETDPATKENLMELFLTLGHTFEVAEHKLESYAILSAMLPTYFWFQWETLKSIGAETGLDEHECEESIYHTTLAALNLMQQGGLTYEQLTDLIPVKPIGDCEPSITDYYKTRLLPLFQKIKP